MAFVGEDLCSIGQGLQRWDEVGLLMREVSNDLETDDVGGPAIQTFAADPFDPRIRYAVNSPWGTVIDRSLNGLTWEWGAASVPEVRHSPDDLLFVSPATGWVYLAARYGGFYRSKRLGQAWEDVTDGLPTGLVPRCLAADPTDIPALYLGSDRGMYWSSAGGSRWERLAGGPEAPVAATAVANRPLRYLFVGTEQGTLCRFLLADQVPTAVANPAPGEPPDSTCLLPLFPNPSNGGVTITYRLAADNWVNLDIYNAAGQAVRRLVDQEQAAGRYQVTWDGMDEAGRALASGVYFYQLVAGPFHQTRRLVLVR
jgi:hypothetical protein